MQKLYLSSAPERESADHGPVSNFDGKPESTANLEAKRKGAITINVNWAALPEMARFGGRP